MFSPQKSEVFEGGEDGGKRETRVRKVCVCGGTWKKDFLQKQKESAWEFEWKSSLSKIENPSHFFWEILFSPFVFNIRREVNFPTFIQARQFHLRCHLRHHHRRIHQRRQVLRYIRAHRRSNLLHLRIPLQFGRDPKHLSM